MRKFFRHLWADRRFWTSKVVPLRNVSYYLEFDNDDPEPTYTVTRHKWWGWRGRSFAEHRTSLWAIKGEVVNFG